MNRPINLLILALLLSVVFNCAAFPQNDESAPIACLGCMMPKCSPGQVLTKGVACSINPAELECPKCIDISDATKLSCESDSDCPSGICNGGNKYDAFSCIEGLCDQLVFIQDPCNTISRCPDGNILKECGNFEIENGSNISFKRTSRNKIQVTVENDLEEDFVFDLKLKGKRRLEILHDDESTILKKNKN